MNKPYPEWTCKECGIEHGTRLPEMATWHEDKCDVCGEIKSVTEPRDFNHFKNWDSPKNSITMKFTPKLKRRNAFLRFFQSQ